MLACRFPLVEICVPRQELAIFEKIKQVVWRRNGLQTFEDLYWMIMQTRCFMIMQIKLTAFLWVIASF